MAVLQLAGWKDLKSALITEWPVLIIDETDHSYTITCSSAVADAVLERIQNFFKENAIREMFASTATVGMATVVNNYLKSEILAVCDDFAACNVSVTMVVDDATKGSGFEVRGTIHGLENAVKHIQGLLAKVIEREKTIVRPGMPQYLQSPRGQESMRSIEAKHQAYIGEVVENVAVRPVTVSPTEGPEERMTVMVAKKFVIKLVVGDITEYRVDAIVNAANTSLDHAGGVARSIVDKGMTDSFFCMLCCLRSLSFSF